MGTGLAVIQAPAGYGKTTLLAQFATEAVNVGFQPLWLSLDSTSAMPAAFALQIAEALDEQNALPHLVGGATTADLKAFIARAAVGGRSRRGSPFLLIVDNSQEISDSPGSLELLDWLIAYLAEGHEVILSGRETLTLAGKTGAIAAGDHLWLGSTDLAFDSDEIAALQELNERPEPSSSTISEATRGWPIAVLATMRGTVALDGSRPELAPGAWDQYLLQHVWSSVPDSLKEAVATLSVTPTVDNDLGVELVGAESWAKLKTWFDPQSWLVEQLPDGSVRLNPLLRKFLLSRNTRLDLAGVHVATDQVAGHLVQRGRLVDALEAALTTEHHELLASLLEEHCGDELLRGSFAVLGRAFEALSDKLIASRPLLAAYRARVKAETGKPNEALEEKRTRYWAITALTGPSRSTACSPRFERCASPAK